MQYSIADMMIPFSIAISDEFEIKDAFFVLTGITYNDQDHAVSIHQHL